MKHIRGFSRITESASQVSPLGFIFHFSDTFHYGVADTFHDFACEVIDLWAEHRDERDEDRYYFDFRYLLQDLLDSLEGADHFREDSLEDSVLWTGLQPKGSWRFVEAISSINPVLALDAISAKFTNVREIMTRYDRGNWGDPIYLAKSIENSPSALGKYLESYDSSTPGDEYTENSYSLDEILAKLSRGYRESDEFRHLIKYHRFKGML